MSRSATTRRSLAGLTLGALAMARSFTVSAQTVQNTSFGILASGKPPAAPLALFDADSGEIRATFALTQEAEAAWATPLPGVGLARTNSTFYVVDGNNGDALQVAVPEAAVPDLAPNGIQFRGSAGYERVLVGTPFFDANTYIVDLLSAERTAVVGLLSAESPPTSLQNVALSADQRRLLAWDGRSTWIVDLESRFSRVIGTGKFTFSAGFSDSGESLVYSQEMVDGSTQLLLEDTTGNWRVIGESANGILVSLWLPQRDLLLLDERSDAGGILAVLDPATGNRQDVLEYTGATNLVQLSPDGQYALVGIEGGEGPDWYQLSLSLNQPAARLLPAIAGAAVSPGFDFHAAWALAMPPIDVAGTGKVNAVDLETGSVTPLIPAITSDAELSGQVVAPSGTAALLKIDSFTELAIHYLRLDSPRNLSIDIMKGGSAVISPDGDRFAVSANLNAGGEATVVYDAFGNDGATFRGHGLAWI